MCRSVASLSQPCWGSKALVNLTAMGCSSSIFPSPDLEVNPSILPPAHNTGGSLPDLTNIQFPPPLSTPLDPDDGVSFPSLGSAGSTGSLSTDHTHLGVGSPGHGNQSQELSQPSSKPSTGGRRGEGECYSPDCTPIWGWNPEPYLSMPIGALHPSDPAVCPP